MTQLEFLQLVKRMRELQKKDSPYTFPRWTNERKMVESQVDNAIPLMEAQQAQRYPKQQTIKFTSEDDGNREIH